MLAPATSSPIEVTFVPGRAGNFTSIMRLSLVDIPGSEVASLPDGELVSAEFELNATCLPVRAQLLPPVIDIPGEIPAGSRLKRQFHLLNPSRTGTKIPNYLINPIFG